MDDPAVGSDEERRPLDAEEELAVERALAPGAVAVQNGVVRVGDEREREAEAARERLVALGRVRRQADDRDAGGVERLGVVAEVAGLYRAARRVVLGVDVERDRAPAEVCETDRLAGLGRALEVGREVAGLRHH